jgi:hypothetical protein
MEGAARISESSRAVRGGATHTRPRRPRPADWYSVITTVPGWKLGSGRVVATRLVEPTSGKYTSCEGTVRDAIASLSRSIFRGSRSMNDPEIQKMRKRPVGRFLDSYRLYD